MSESKIGAVGKLRYDSKFGRPLEEITKQFKSQIEGNNCWPTCITNALMDMALMHKADINFSQSEVNKLCRYRMWFGPQDEVVVRNVDERLRKYGFRAYEDAGLSQPRLVTMLTETRNSYPLVGLPPGYLVTEWKAKIEDKRELDDHVVIVLLMNNDEVGFFDPFFGRNDIMKRASQGNGKGVCIMPTPRFLSYWDGALQANWAMWISREKKKAPEVEGQSHIDSPIATEAILQ